MDLDAYFARVGFKGARVPTLDTLRELHLAHAQAIAFENLNPLLGLRVSLDLPAVEEKIVRSGRGGYCFEQNALFAAALHQLGFKVTGLAARVLWNVPDETIRPRAHMLLKIELDDESYVADVGFGGLTLTGPLRLVADVEQSTPHERFRFVSHERDLKLQALIGDAWKTLYRFDLQPQHAIDYEISNYYMSTSPTSHFRTALIAARPFPGGRYALANNQLTIHRLGALSERRVLASVKEVRDVLEQLFGLTLPPAAELDPALGRACGFPA